jgi:hypothetical protein
LRWDDARSKFFRCKSRANDEDDEDYLDDPSQPMVTDEMISAATRELEKELGYVHVSADHRLQ